MAAFRNDTMLFWLILALMTGATALALLWPLARARQGLARGASDVAIYKDQLAEIERDRERGLIAGAEAQAAKLEVSRRLIEADRTVQASAAAPSSSLFRRRAAAVLVLLAFPGLSLGLYSRYGSPNLPDHPREATTTAPADSDSLDVLVAKFEQAVAEKPDDGTGWEKLARLYYEAQRYEDARRALGNALRILGSSAEREANYGLAATKAANGVITADARSAFEKAKVLAPNEPLVRFFLGEAKEQDGDKVGAIAAWKEILALPGLPPGFLDQVRAEIARLDPSAPVIKGPTQDDVAAAGQLTREQRAQMVETMVAGLAARLKDKGGTAEEWLKLIKAYSVLGKKEAAQTAAADARKALAASPDDLKSIDDFSRALGL